MIWLNILILSVASILILRVFYLFVTSSIGGFIQRKHKAIERILNTRTPCSEWLDPWRKWAGCSGSQAAAIHGAKGACLKHLDSLIRYARRSTLVDDEETRSLLLEQLESVRKEWDDIDWSKLLTVNG